MLSIEKQSPSKQLKSFNARFSAPVFPGETLRTEVWREDNVIIFRSRVTERDVVVLNNGQARAT